MVYLYKIKEIKSCKPSSYKNGDYYVCLICGNTKFEKIFLRGPMIFKPYPNDILKYKTNNNEEWCKYPIVLLPDTKKDQKLRLIEILRNNNCYTDDNLNFFNKFNYGSNNLWFDIYNCYLTYNAVYDIILPDFLKVVFNHISNYINNIIEPFTKELKNKNINLTKTHYLSLFSNNDFGPDITNWKEKNVIKLLDKENFGISSVLKIALGLKYNPNTITMLLIKYKLEEKNLNSSSVLKYNYKKWKKEIIEYLRDESNNEMLNINIIEYLCEDNFNKIIKDMVDKKFVIQINDYLISKKFYDLELDIAKMLQKILIDTDNILLSDSIIEDDSGLIDIINDYSRKDIEQQHATKTFFKNSINIIHGRAGTGKTTTIQTIIESLIYLKNYKFDFDINISFLAPTAKALEKIKSSVDMQNNGNVLKYDFKTIHSFNCSIKYNDEFQKKLHDVHNIFIIDETSMLDTGILHSFLSNIKNYNKTLVFLGDYRQLPSIGIGNVFKNLLDSKTFNMTELTNTYRYRDKKHLNEIIQKVLNGHDLNIDDININTLEFEYRDIVHLKTYLLNYSTNTDYSKNIVIANTNSLADEYNTYIQSNKKSANIDDVNNYIKIINKLELINIENFKFDIKTKTDTCIEIVLDNKHLYFYSEIKLKTTVFKISDRVIYTKNVREKLYNGLSGEIEIICKIEDKSYLIMQSDLGEYHKFDLSEHLIYDLKLSYALTIYKAQGSEYNDVCIILSNSRINNRNLIYTALSRARNKIIIFSKLNIINKAISIKINRKTILKYALKYYCLENGNQMLSIKEYLSKNFKNKKLT